MGRFFLNEAAGALEENSLYQQDVIRLHKMTDRPVGESCCN
jgi:hypothetical protein